MGRRLGRFGSGWTAAVVGVALVAGCADPTAMVSPGGGTPVAISDPVVAFAANASPGAEDSVVLPSTGQTAQLRMVRAYAAASGRECREIQVRTGGGVQMRLLCSAGTGWREARPLLTGAAARP
jgi:hypothetical protein